MLTTQSITPRPWNIYKAATALQYGEINIWIMIHLNVKSYKFASHLIFKLLGCFLMYLHTSTHPNNIEPICALKLDIGFQNPNRYCLPEKHFMFLAAVVFCIAGQVEQIPQQQQNLIDDITTFLAQRVSLTLQNIMKTVREKPNLHQRWKPFKSKSCYGIQVPKRFLHMIDLFAEHIVICLTSTTRVWTSSKRLDITNLSVNNFL